MPSRRGPRKPGHSAASAPWRAGAVPGLLAVLGLLLASRMLTQVPFSLYVSTVFQAPHWLVGLCYGLLALGFVASAALWARHFEGLGLGEALTRIAAVALGCVALAALAGLTRSIAVFALVHLLWGALLGATTPVLTALVSRAADARSQGRVLGPKRLTPEECEKARRRSGPDAHPPLLKPLQP